MRSLLILTLATNGFTLVCILSEGPTSRSMRLTATSGDSLELEVLGYQFPELETADYDSNWLRIRITASLAGRGWTTTDPSLLTYEAAELAAWLKDLGSGAPYQVKMSFIEPNLAFEVVEDSSDGRRLRVYLELEARPPWARADGAPAEDLWLEFPVASEMLIAAAGSLQDQCERYPPRAHV